MPGFEISRFTEPNAEVELRKMTCLICKDIVYHPVVTACCGQTFCESCLKPWIDSNHTCPSDLKPLEMKQLLPPPAIMCKILNRKKVRCAFKELGCNEIITVENVDKHETACNYKFLCQNCGLSVVNSSGSTEHDCLTSLLEFKQTIAGQTDKIRKQIEQAKVESKNLRAQMDIHIKTLKELTLLDAVGARQVESKPGGAIRVASNKELLSEARKYVTSPVVDAHKTPKDIVDKSIETLKDMLLNKGDEVYHMTRAMKEYMDAHFAGDWNVYVVYNNVGYMFHNVIPEAFIEIKFGKALFTIYKTFDTICYNRLVGFVKTGVVRDLKATHHGFDDAATGEIKEIVLACLKICKETSEFHDKVAAQLIAKYGGIWHCFLYRAHYGFYCVRSEKGRYCLLSNAEIQVLVFCQ